MMAIMAYYLILVLMNAEAPVLVGPFFNEEGRDGRSECMDVQDWLRRRGYETGGCSILPSDQESILVKVGYLPK